MKYPSQFLSLAALIAVSAAPAAAATTETAYSATAPVAVGSCSVDESHAISAGPQPGFLLYTRDLVYNFTNRANVPATNVVMTVNDGTSTRTVSSRGTFAPGVQISRVEDAGLSTASQNDAAACTVSRVDFANGTSWQAGSAVSASVAAR